MITTEVMNDTPRFVQVRGISPPLDPIPSYAPTSLRILVERVNNASTNYLKCTQRAATNSITSPDSSLRSYSCSEANRGAVGFTVIRKLTRGRPKAALKGKNATAFEIVTPNESIRTAKSEHFEEPVMWSPQLPSQIQPVEDDEKDKTEAETEKYRSSNTSKQRAAHKPKVPQNKQKRPRKRLGTVRKL